MVGKNINAFRFIYDLRDSVTSFWSSFFIILSQQGPVFRRWSIFAYSFDFSEIFACAKKLCSVIDSAVSVTLLSFLWNRGVLQVFFLHDFIVNVLVSLILLLHQSYYRIQLSLLKPLLSFFLIQAISYYRYNIYTIYLRLLLYHTYILSPPPPYPAV